MRRSASTSARRSRTSARSARASGRRGSLACRRRGAVRRAPLGKRSALNASPFRTSRSNSSSSSSSVPLSPRPSRRNTRREKAGSSRSDVAVGKDGTPVALFVSALRFTPRRPPRYRTNHAGGRRPRAPHCRPRRYCRTTRPRSPWRPAAQSRVATGPRGTHRRRRS